LLKAAIIYLQGSGGNLIARTLTLSEQTVAYLPKSYCAEQPTTNINSHDRLKLYNNWDSNDWSQSEINLAIWYHFGYQDFYKYEETDLWLIDQFHPARFQFELNEKILFADATSWEHLIFIQWKKSSLDNIIKLAELKRPDLTQRYQIENNELAVFENIINTFHGHIIYWEDMLDEDTYIESIVDLAQKLNLVLDFSLVRQLWKLWKYETDKALLNA